MKNLTAFLEEKYAQFNQPDFVAHDPISLPHAFSRRQDIEIVGFWVAMLAWGQRVTIIRKGEELVRLMEGEPYNFVRNHSEHERKAFLAFKHRTFNATDALYFLEFLQRHYQQSDTLETAFADGMQPTDDDVGNGLVHFHRYFFSLPDFPPRTRKHIATPERNSACKRLNMFLRWMVRRDGQGVDFGLWERIAPRQLICPLDVHVERVARKLGLLTRKQSDWRAACELTAHLRTFDAQDPVKYDFALFGLGLEGF